MYGGLTALRFMARKYEFRDEVRRTGSAQPLQLLLLARPAPCDAAHASELGTPTPLAHIPAHTPQEERGPLVQIINTTFPALLPILHGVLANPAAGATAGLTPAHYVKLAFKVFWSCTFMGIPDALLADNQFRGWMGGVHDVLRRALPMVRARAPVGCVHSSRRGTTPAGVHLCSLVRACAARLTPVPPHTPNFSNTPQQDQAPADKEDRVKWVWVKTQKWALHIAYRMFTRYANPPRCQPGNDTEFAKRFAVRCAIACHVTAHALLALHKM